MKSKAVIEREFRPSIETTERNYRYGGWKKRWLALRRGKITSNPEAAVSPASAACGRRFFAPPAAAAL
ncbi:hypothetical protein M8494_31745 [Serratia ureilytica]